MLGVKGLALNDLVIFESLGVEQTETDGYSDEIDCSWDME